MKQLQRDGVAIVGGVMLVSHRAESSRTPLYFSSLPGVPSGDQARSFGMFARPTVLLAAVLLPAVAAAQGIEYAPSTSQYHIVSKTHGSQEAMGQKNDF